MNLWQRKKKTARRTSLQRPRLRSGRLGCEPLEDRRLLTLLGVVPVLPAFTYDSNGLIQYSASAHTFDLTATPLTFRNTSGPPHNVTAPRGLAIHVLVDNSGNLISGTPGDDIVINGTVDPDGIPADTVSGTLLTGEVLGFGFAESGATDQYDFRFRPTGGQLFSYFAGDDIAMTVNSENSTFNNDFTQDFTGGAKGSIGNIAPLPGHIIVDKITNPGGDPTSFNFSTTGGSYAGFGLTDTDAPNDQTLVPGAYSVSELVPPGWDLANLSVVDPTGNSTSSGSTASLVLDSGETIHVTYTDTKRGTIQVVKDTDGGDDTFGFTGTGGSNLPGSFNITTAGGTGSGTTYSVAPGSYSVLESGLPAGWDFSSVDISENGGAVDSTTSGAQADLNVQPGETIVVTYHDTKRATIQVVKDTAGGDDTFGFTGTGGSNLPGSFNVTTAGGTGSGTTYSVAPGSYSVLENVPAGWDLANLTISETGGTSDSTTSGAQGNLIAEPGETIVLTYNDVKRGTIQVVKNTVGGNDTFAFTGTGGSNLPGSFNVTTAGGTGSGTTYSVAPGSYSVLENVPAGWDLSNLSISETGGAANSTTSGAQGNLIAEPGETIVLTYNDVKRGTIQVVKNTVGGNDTFAFTGTGGSNLPGSFNIATAGGTGSSTTYSVTPGSYSVLENIPAGWDLSNLSISETGGAANSTTSGAQGNLVVDPGENIVLTYVDTKRATIQVVKNTVGGNGTFAFTGTGGSNLPGSFNIATAGGTGSSTTYSVTPGSYSVLENIPAGWDLSNLSISETGGAANSTTSGAQGNLIAEPGETIVLTYNDVKRGTIQVVKNTVGGNDTFAFTGTGGSNLPGSFNIATAGGTGSSTTYSVTPGSYSVLENIPAGWDLSNLSISETGGAANSTTSGAQGNLVVDPGENIVLTYVDTKRATIQVVKNTVGGNGTFAFTGTGGSNLPGSFNVTTAGGTGSSTTYSVTPGSYSVLENIPAGWDLTSLNISETGGTANSTKSGAQGNLVADAGETIVLTYCDTKRGSIQVVKNTVGGNGTFAFTGTGGSNLPGSFNVTTAGGTGSSATYSVTPGSYGVLENIPAGWDLTSLNISESGGTANSTKSGAQGNLVVDPGETILLTYCDTKRATIQVVKNAIGGNGTFNFTSTGGSTLPGTFSITTSGGTGSTSVYSVTPGNYSVLESSLPAGWVLTSLNVNESGGTANSTTSGATATLKADAGETIVVTYCDTKAGSISGTKYFDVTGNGLTSDDTPMSGVKIFLDTNNDGVWESGEQSQLTGNDGTYSFVGLAAGTYVVREVTPTGFVRTGPTLADNYTINLAAGATSSGNNFANAEMCAESLCNIVYIINGTTAVSDLRGNTNEGDTVEVQFTVPAGQAPHPFTLVSYTAPGPTFVAAQAAQQQIFDIDTGVFGPGTYTLTVTIPHSYYQVDFVCGNAIDHFGPANSNIFYSAQSRLFSADNDGTHAVLASGGKLSGFVYVDANADGQIQVNERAVSGAIIKLTGTDTGGHSVSQSAMTDYNGMYLFDNLAAGTYTVTETQPGEDFTDGVDSVGSLGGTKQNDKFTGIVLGTGAAGINYNFGEKEVTGTAVAANQTANVAFWNSTSGQTLIKALNGSQNATSLSTWLASNFDNIYGASAGVNNLTGKTNAQVAIFYQSLASTSSKKLDAETMALALNVYVTKSGLAGTAASSYGFAVSANGLGAATVNVGDSSAAFGVNDNAVLTVLDLLYRTNDRATNGILWDTDGNGTISTAETLLRNEAYLLFNTIDNT